jgi:hypothetical protein
MGDELKTHVRVHTSKALRGGIHSSAFECGKTANGFTYDLSFANRKDWNELMPCCGIRCTQKSVSHMHEQALQKFRTLRPELFVATTEQQPAT